MRQRAQSPPQIETIQFLKPIPEEEEEPPPTLPYLTVILPLLLVYISNQWSRSSLYYLVNFSPDASPASAINLDLGFSESQYGILASVAFTFLYAGASLIAGNLADKVDRKLLTSASCAAWTIATVGTAMSASYDQVVLARIFMGLACAFTTPAAYTLIRDTFPKEQAALASSTYGSGVYFGGALASLSILLVKSFGWRGATYGISGFGAVACVLSYLVLPQDPKLLAGGVDDEKTTSKSPREDAQFSLFKDAAEVLTIPQIQFLLLASFLRFCSGLCIGVWSAPYFRLAFPESASQYAVVNAFIVGLCGVTSALFGGYLADTFAKSSTENQNVGRMVVPVAGSLLAAPTFYYCIHSSSFEYAMIWLAVSYLVAECWFGPTIAVLQSSAGKERGGTAQGVFTLVGAFANLAPSLLGFWYEKQQLVQTGSNVDTLANSLGLFVCVGYVLSSFVFFLGLNSQRELNV